MRGAVHMLGTCGASACIEVLLRVPGHCYTCIWALLCVSLGAATRESGLYYARTWMRKGSARTYKGSVERTREVIAPTRSWGCCTGTRTCEECCTSICSGTVCARRSCTHICKGIVHASLGTVIEHCTHACALHASLPWVRVGSMP